MVDWVGVGGMSGDEDIDDMGFTAEERMSDAEDRFEQREAAGRLGYWDDPRWKEVKKLRRKGEHAKANSLVFKIRSDWDVD